MLPRILLRLVSFTLSLLLVAQSAAAASPAASTKESGQAILGVLAAATAQSVWNAREPLELICPASPEFFNQTQAATTSEEKASEIYEFLATFLPIAAGKATELLQGDVCQAIMRAKFPDEEALYHFCDNPENLPLSKATAKSVGKVAKAFQQGKGGFALFSIGVSAYGSVKLSQNLAKAAPTLPQAAVLATLAVALEQFSKPEMVNALAGPEVGDYYIAFDHWLGRPFIYRTASTGCRYALEKVLQQPLTDKETQRQIASWILSHSYISKRSAEILSKGSAIGLSKVGSGTLAASVISVAEITLDAFSEEPEFKTLYERVEKYFKDLGVAIGTNMLVAVTLPSTLVAGKPSRIVLAIMVANVLHWVAFSH